MSRSIGVTTATLVVALLIAATSVLTGTLHLDVRGGVDALVGGGSPTDRFLIVDQRLPRAVAALIVGAALGASGAIFQSLSRNPLGSPDVIGFTTGASTGGLVVILLATAPSAVLIAGGAIVGGFGAALAVILTTVRSGVTGERLILAGIAIGATLASVNDYLISRAPVDLAQAAKDWKYGSLNLIGWSQVGPLAAAVALLMPIAAASTRSLRVLEMGDDVARSLGLNVPRRRSAIIVIGVLLAAMAVATAGPIGFLALAAPRIGRKATRSPSPAILPAAAMGAALLAGSDLLARRLLDPFQIPVGLVSAALGGLYLLWLLGLSRD